jgi:hypothetical protein
MRRQSGRIRQQKGRVGHIQVAGSRFREALKAAHDIVSQITDRTADQTRQPFDGHPVDAVKFLPDSIEWVLTRFQRIGRCLAMQCARYDTVFDGDDAFGIDPQK